jgi:hypothetical protein
MATVAEQFWREILDIRQPLDPPRRPHRKGTRAVLLRRTVRRDPRSPARCEPNAGR